MFLIEVFYLLDKYIIFICRIFVNIFGRVFDYIIFYAIYQMFSFSHYFFVKRFIFICLFQSENATFEANVKERMNTRIGKSAQLLREKTSMC